MKIIIATLVLLMSFIFTVSAELKILSPEELNKHIEMAEKGKFQSMLELIGHYENTGKYDLAIQWCEKTRDFAVKGADTINYEERKKLRPETGTKESFIKAVTDRFNHRIEMINKLKKNASNQRVDPTVKTPVESGNEQGTAGHP